MGIEERNRDSRLEAAAKVRADAELMSDPPIT